jgi:hypothetical protein
VSEYVEFLRELDIILSNHAVYDYDIDAYKAMVADNEREEEDEDS